MKAVILAGGLGTRISEETHLKPKPMIEIGGKPILWHIMKLYSSHGVSDFIICCGYKGYVIKEYFANYFLHMSDVTFDMQHNRMEVHHRKAEPWRVTLVDTGDETLTGGRFNASPNTSRMRKHSALPMATGSQTSISRRRLRFTNSTASGPRLPPCNRPDDTARCNLTVPSWTVLPKSPVVMAASSTAAFSFSRPDASK